GDPKCLARPEDDREADQYARDPIDEGPAPRPYEGAKSGLDFVDRCRHDVLGPPAPASTSTPVPMLGRDPCPAALKGDPPAQSLLAVSCKCQSRDRIWQSPVSTPECAHDP